MLEIDWKDIMGWSEAQMRDARSIGYLYYKQGAFDIAAKCFEALITINPHALYELQTLGAIYLEMNRPKEALTLIDRALSIQPGHEPTLFHRCKALLAMGDKTGALEIAHLLENSSDTIIAKSARSLLAAHTGSPV